MPSSSTNVRRSSGFGGAKKGDKIDKGFVVLLISSANSNLVILVFSLFLPLFAKQLGASIFEIGLVGGASNIVYSFMPFLMGRLANTASARRFFIIFSFVVLSIVTFLYFTATSPVELILLRLFEGLGWSTFWPAVEATLTHDSPRDPKRSLAIFNFSWSGAAAVGPLFGALLAFVLTIRDLFLVCTIVIFATLILNLIWIGNSREKNHITTQPENKITFAEAEAEVVKQETETVEEDEDLGVPRRISSTFYLVSMAICAVSSSVLLTFFSPFGRSVGISILFIGIASFVFGFGRFGFYFLTIRKGFRRFLYHHNNRVRNVLISISVLSVSSLLIVLPNQRSSGIYILSFAIVGIGYSVVYSISQVALLAEATKEKMGTGAGLFESSIGVGAAAGPVLAGAISGASLSNTFLTPSICLLPTLAILLLILRHDRSQAKI